MQLERKELRRSISDLGAAAYLKMHGFKCVGRKGKYFYFEMIDEEVQQFDQLTYEYTNSPMHDFDAAIMSLKKLPEYLPEKTK